MSINNPTAILALERLADGTADSTWGDRTVANFNRLEAAIAGSVSIAVTVSDVTLTTSDSTDTASDMQSRYAAFTFTGTLTGNRAVIVPAVSKIFFVYNNTSGAYSLTVKTSGGTGIAVTQGKRGVLYCDGTNVVDVLSNYQITATILDAIAALSSTGLVARTGSGTVSARTLTQPAAGITVTNGDGVSGNPTLALANDLSAVEGLSGTGVAVRTASDTWTTRTITGTSNQITVTNGDGVSGAPTISLPSAITLPGSIASAYAVVGTIQTLTDAATITVDLSAGNNAKVTLGGNRTFAAPTVTAGQAGSIFITQDGTGSRTGSFNSVYKFPSGTAPVLSTTAGAVDRLDYIALDTTHIHCVLTKNVS